MSDSNRSFADSDVFVSQEDLSASRTSPIRHNRINLSLGEFAGYAYFIVTVLLGPGLIISWLGRETANSVLAIALGLLVGLPFLLYGLVKAVSVQNSKGIPILRNLIFLQDLAQSLFLIGIVAFLYLILINLDDNLAKNPQLAIDFNVLTRPFGTEISEGPDPRSTTLNEFLDKIPLIGDDLANAKLLQPNSNFRALMVGVVNTLRVVWISLIAATLLGILVGVGLLSNNWLVQNVSKVYVEIFRNTPLLVQLFFITKAMILLLPTAQTADKPYDYHWSILGQEFQIYLSGKQFNYPKIMTTDTYNYLLVPLLIGLVAAFFLRRWRLKVLDETGQPAYVLRYTLGAIGGAAVLGIILALVAGGSPLAVENPYVEGTSKLRIFQPVDGARFSAEYIGLFLSLVLYTAAFIADIVRAGIQSVPWGQVEAARAVGFSNGQTLRMIILPQAMRLIIPPLTNQYLNLAKNSSLATAIGYTDLFTVTRLIANPTGQTVALFACMMAIYLIMSLLISLVMNIFNRTIQLKER